MPEERDVPVSIDLGSINEKSVSESAAIKDDDEISAPVSIDLGVGDGEATPSTTFSGSVTTNVGVIQVDPSLMPPEKEGMKKGQFFLGLFLPIVLSIVMSIVVVVSEEAMYDDWDEKFTITKNSDGTFTFNPSDHGMSCQDEYFEFEFRWENVNHSRHGSAWADCDSHVSADVAYQSGRWHSDGTLELNFPHAPVDGFDIRVTWWDGNSERSTSMGIGDGENKNFSKDIGNRNQYCDIWGNVQFEIDGETTYADIGCDSGEGSYTVFLYAWETLVKNSGEWGVPVNFTLPAGNEDVEQITVQYWDYGGGGEDLIEMLPLFFCFGFIGMILAAFKMGYKWFAYGALTSLVVAPLIFVVACFGFLILFW